MLVIDYINSETGPQRRTTHSCRSLHCCCICGMVAPWGRTSWSWYGSIKDEDDGFPLAKFCSPACAIKAGDKAVKVSDEMKEKARAAELREPHIVYREATEAEKYRAAEFQQRKPTFTGQENSEQ